MTMRFSNERRDDAGEPRKEQRFWNAEDFTAEFRVEKRDGQPSKITGYPAKFNRLSQRMYGMRENILPGAFARSIREGADVRALLNHDPNIVLGRTGPGTLRLEETVIGLHMEIDPPDTQAARDLMTSIERGDISQGSFQFRCMTDNWRMQDGVTVRDLVDVDLIDVSPVTFPAYLDTSAQVRTIAAIAADIGIDFERLGTILVKHQHKFEMKPEDLVFVRNAVELLSFAKDVEPHVSMPYLDAAKRRLALAERT